MTPWQKRTNALTQRMAEDMLLRNLSQKTIDAYTYHVGRFAQFLGRSPEDASPEDVRSFQLHLIKERKVGWSSFNQAVCGLRFLYRTTFPRHWAVRMVPFGKKPKKLPAVLSGDEVHGILQCIREGPKVLGTNGTAACHQRVYVMRRRSVPGEVCVLVSA